MGLSNKFTLMFANSYLSQKSPILKLNNKENSVNVALDIWIKDIIIYSSQCSIYLAVLILALIWKDVLVNIEFLQNRFCEKIKVTWNYFVNKFYNFHKLNFIKFKQVSAL